MTLIGTICHIYLLEMFFTHRPNWRCRPFQTANNINATCFFFSCSLSFSSLHFSFSFYHKNTKHSEWSITCMINIVSLWYNADRAFVELECRERYAWCINTTSEYFSLFLYSCSINQSNELNSLNGSAFALQCLCVSEWMCVWQQYQCTYITSLTQFVRFSWLPIGFECATLP